MCIVHFKERNATKQAFSQQTLLHQKTEHTQASVSSVWGKCHFWFCREIKSFWSSWMDSNLRPYMITLWYFSIFMQFQSKTRVEKVVKVPVGEQTSRLGDLERRSAEISGCYGHWAGSTTGSFQPAAFLQKVKLFAFSFNSILLKALLRQCVYAIAHAYTSSLSCDLLEGWADHIVLPQVLEIIGIKDCSSVPRRSSK